MCPPVVNVLKQKKPSEVGGHGEGPTSGCTLVKPVDASSHSYSSTNFTELPSG